MGGDLCPEGCGFESQHCILDGHYFTFVCCKKIVMIVSKDGKEDGDGPFKKVMCLNLA